LIASFKKINPVYNLFVLLLILFTLSNGPAIAIGIPRMSAAFFPVYIALARIDPDQLLGKSLIILLIVMQIVLMAFWSNGLLII
jgi:hypothetical protein